MDINFTKDVPIENQLEQLKDIATHKAYVMQACYKMSCYFIKKGNPHLALALMKRAFDHDFSKLNEDEFYGMAEFAFDTEAMTNVNVDHTCDSKMVAIRLHQSRNNHHPEYWGERIIHMPELDIIEMCCDWYSRSLQFNNDVVEWLKKKQEIRFNFPTQIFEKALFFCNILNSNEEDWQF